tara:strand:- start:1329 stop:1799 length:471 start_codon:yes stop_codon:yes gene_type:complete
MYAMDSPLQVEQVLEVVASVNANDKICTQAGLVDVYKPTATRGVVRWWYGESRFRNFTLIELVVRSAIQTVELHHTHSVNSPCIGAPQPQPRLVRKLRDAKRGLMHLLETYRDDAATCSRLRVMISDVDDFLRTRDDAVGDAEDDASTEEALDVTN